MVIFFGTETSPSSGDSSPTIMRKSVVLPAPFGPTRPARSPGLSWNEASTKTSWRPYCLEILLRLIMRARGRTPPPPGRFLPADPGAGDRGQNLDEPVA